MHAQLLERGRTRGSDKVPAEQLRLHAPMAEKNGWPYVESITGFPTVARAYHDAIMTGVSPTVAKKDQTETEPDFSWAA